jgi:anti-sigma regulatory factor (Ser/Thr protein kinase)
MEVGAGRRLRVDDATGAGEARRQAMGVARGLGFDDSHVGRVAIAVSEASTNMVKHATRGDLVLQQVGENGGRGFAALALDHGPGMARPRDMQADGTSTAGTMGTGLGAIARQSSEFGMWSSAGAGTAVYAGFWPESAPWESSGLAVGAVCVPVDGEFECGDAWAFHGGPERSMLLVVDGLGHGPSAREAAAAAVATFHARVQRGPADLLSDVHDSLRHTRGAAVAIAEIVPGRALLRFAGVGNIAGALIGPGGSRHLVSQFGTVGHRIPKLHELQFPWSPEAHLVLHSDGVKTAWALERYPGLVTCHPMVVAGILWRDFARGKDDATVVVVGRAP